MVSMWCAIGYFAVLLIQKNLGGPALSASTALLLAVFVFSFIGTIVFYANTFLSASKTLGIRISFKNYPSVRRLCLSDLV